MVTTLLKEMKSKMSQLESKLDKLLQTSSKTPTYDRSSENYCWSHGRTFNHNHTSKNCRFQKPGHKEDATLHNKMGGSTKQCGEWLCGIIQKDNKNDTLKSSSIHNASCISIPSSQTHSAIVDSGCTEHYFPPSTPVLNLETNSNDFNVILPDSSKITATHTASVPIPALNEIAT